MSIQFTARTAVAVFLLIAASVVAQRNCTKEEVEIVTKCAEKDAVDKAFAKATNAFDYKPANLSLADCISANSYWKCAGEAGPCTPSDSYSHRGVLWGACWLSNGDGAKVGQFYHAIISYIEQHSEEIRNNCTQEALADAVDLMEARDPDVFHEYICPLIVQSRGAACDAVEGQRFCAKRYDKPIYITIN